MMPLVCWQPFFSSKGHLDQCLVIANAKGWYGGGGVGKKARQGWFGQVGSPACFCVLYNYVHFYDRWLSTLD